MVTLHNIAVIGAAGGIGQAFVEVLSKQYPQARLYPFARTGAYPLNYASEEAMAAAAHLAAQTGPLDLVIVTNGILHNGPEMMPEKSLKDLSRDKFQQSFEANTIVPALIMKHFLPQLNKANNAIFAALSARIGSISDNQLGGWYAYRAAKAALNMLIKNAAIEIGRLNKTAIIVGLHPGSVDTNLSRPFHKQVPAAQLFTPHVAVQHLLTVLAELTPAHTGKCFAWNGEEILP